jgi:hypothetical protein
MKKIFNFSVKTLLVLCVIFVAGCSGSNDPDSPSNIVKASYVEVFPTIVYSNAAVFYYKINWEPVKGATGYNFYKSNVAGDASATKVSSEGQDATVMNADETITQVGNTVRYYWATAITKSGETKRPSNGGIKVTYHIVLKTIYGVGSYYECTRTIEQNPTK